jgi:hypothetical protein
MIDIKDFTTELTLKLMQAQSTAEFRKIILNQMEKDRKKLGPTPEEIDAALAEHNLHEEWLDLENFNSLNSLLQKEMSDKRDEE